MCLWPHMFCGCGWDVHNVSRSLWQLFHRKTVSHKTWMSAVSLCTQEPLGHHDCLSELSSLKGLLFCGPIHLCFGCMVGQLQGVMRWEEKGEWLWGWNIMYYDQVHTFGQLEWGFNFFEWEDGIIPLQSGCILLKWRKAARVCCNDLQLSQRER